MGPTILILLSIGALVAIGIFIAGANPELAARWDAWRRKILGG